MTSLKINSSKENETKNFKSAESDSWSGIYLPAICAGGVMTIVLFVAVACSKSADKPSSSITAPPQPAVTGTPAPVAAMPSTTPKKVKKHRPTTATYVNNTYGVSFSYPRKYSLQTGDKHATSPIQTNFLKPGAVQIASVDMPDSAYPDTDFSSALLNLSMNQGMTADECAQFLPATKDAGEVKLATASFGGNQFTVFEQINGMGDRKSDLKYFHLFKNNACYEFALDVDTTAKADGDLAQVDRDKVFKQLEKILATARIKDVKPAEVENAAITEPAAADVKAPVETQKAQVVVPEQK